MDNNPYYHPEKMGLEAIGSLEEDLSYEFNILAAWKHKMTGAVYYAGDSGCSCPTPFESFNDLASLSEIKSPAAFDEFERLAGGWDLPLEDRNAFVAQVRQAWRGE